MAEKMKIHINNRCFGLETPDCPGEDGAEGAIPLHSLAHVLGSI